MKPESVINEQEPLSEPSPSLSEIYFRAGEAAAHLLHPDVYSQLPTDIRNELFQICQVDPESENADQQLAETINQKLVKIGQTVEITQPFKKINSH